MDTLFDLPEPETPEEAVVAHYSLSDDQYGSRAERDAIFDAERTMTAAVEEAGVGEVDGNEFGGVEAVLYAYGTDAKALFKVMEPTLRGCRSGRLTSCCGTGARRRRSEWICDAVLQRSTATPATVPGH